MKQSLQYSSLPGLLFGLIVIGARPGISAATELGFTQLQSNTSAAVRVVCGGLKNLERTPLQDQLFATCRSLVQNEDGGKFSRGLSDVGLAAAYQNVATEETLSPVRIGTSSTNAQALTIITRTQQLRAGGGPGFAFNPYQGGPLALNPDRPVSGGNAGDPAEAVLGRFGAFITPHGGFGDTATTAGTNGSDFSNVGFTAGVDYRILDNLIFGLAGGYSNLDLDFSQNTNVAGGSVDADIGSFSAYGTFYEGDFYVDTLFNYGWSNYDINRRVVLPSNNPGVAPINTSALADTDGTQWTFSLQGGYDFHTDALSYGPYARVNYTQVHTDSYTETGAADQNLLIHQQNAESVQSVVGGQIRYAFSQSYGVILPYLRFEWVHEFRDSGRVLAAQYVNDPRNNLLTAFSDNPDRNFFNLNTGVSTVLQDGLQAFFNYNTVLDNDLVSGHLFSIGARMEF